MGKKEIIFLLNIILLLIMLPQINTQAITGETVTGEAVTGEATNSNVAITIPLTGLPSLSILSPENKTYLSNESILLNFSVSSEDFVWYNLDSGSNITITSLLFINVTQGNHTLYLYANNSQGNTTKNVSFTANSSIFIILYSEYSGSNKGISTNFNTSTYEDIQNLSGIVLEHTTYGKILFNEAINLTNDLNSSDLVVDLDTNTNISLNRIEVNSTALPNFNKPATIWIYNLAFDDPRILRDGSVCTSSICTFENYSGGILKFNVTEFSVYSAEETPVEEVIPTGGGKAKTKIIKSFNLSTNEIKINLKQGQAITKEIIITNNGTQNLSIMLENIGLENFFKIEEENFDLNSGESKIINLYFTAKEDTIPNLYIGKFIIKADDIEREISIVIEVESKKTIFDVKVEIPREFEYVLPGEEIIANVKILNLGEIKKVDVQIEYIIKNKENEEILSKNETIIVETKINLVKRFQIPLDLEFGDYVIYVRLNYQGEIASATSWFKVGEEPKLIDYKKIISYIILILTILILIIIIKKIKKKGKK